MAVAICHSRTPIAAVNYTTCSTLGSTAHSIDHYIFLKDVGFFFLIIRRGRESPTWIILVWLWKPNVWSTHFRYNFALKSHCLAWACSWGQGPAKIQRQIKRYWCGVRCMFAWSVYSDTLLCVASVVRRVRLLKLRLIPTLSCTI